MKCNNCKAEWTPPPGVSIVNCPFCGKPIIGPTKTTKDDEPHEVLLKIVHQFNVKILGETKLKGILSDLMPNVEKKYHRIIRQALDDRIGLKLLELDTEDSSVKNVKIATLKDNFKNHNGFNETADYVFDSFLYALGWINSVNKEHYNQGTTDKQSIINAQIDMAFADGVLSKEEAITLFTTSASLGISDDEMAEMINTKIRSLKLQPSGELKKSIKNPKEIICSSDWILPQQRKEAETQQTTTAYETVKIGDQIWMAENLDVDKYNNGDPIPFAKNENEWYEINRSGKGCWAYPDFKKENAELGKVYNYYAVRDIRGLAPNGFRISHIDDWNKLVNNCGGWENIENVFYDLEVAYGFHLMYIIEGTDEDFSWHASFWNISSNRDFLSLKDDNFFTGEDFDYGNKGFVRCLKINTEKGSYSNVYESVIIGNQEWMTKNLDVSHFRNGDPIPEIKTHEDFINARDNGLPGWRYYDNNPENGKKYGKLYNWHAVNDPRGLAPHGWHIPTKDDWETLTNYNSLDDRGRRQFALKLMKPNAWNDNEDATNESGFSALPGGVCRSHGSYFSIGREGLWWSISIEELPFSDNEEEAPVVISIKQLKHGSRIIIVPEDDYSYCYYSVRCLKDIKTST
ncbi:MAG: hypothetical protein K0B11_02800 [Mariniphaga sp.]|nr:hypothetical protein [Mariniphaga sp.]